MTNEELADELIKRLNALCDDGHVRHLLERLVEVRVGATAVKDHPTIQVVEEKEGKVARIRAGFLGVLNGLVGTIPSGEKKDWGYIAAVFDDSGKLRHFKRADSKGIRPAKDS